jgi:signal transduction histidine kinase
MKKKLSTVCSIFVFIAINYLIGIHFFHHLQNLKLKNAPISIEVLSKDPSLSVGIFDIDRDGEDEVVREIVFPDSGNHAISIYEPFEKDYLSHFYGEILVPDNYEFFDAYYDKALDTYIFKFLELRNGKIVLEERDNHQNLQKRITLENMSEKLPLYEVGFLKPIKVDLEPDGKDELVIIFGIDDKKYPRGVACFDPESGKRLWEYYSGTQIVTAKFKDLDGKPGKEIILSSFAAHDGMEKNGTNDSYSYVILLDGNGRECWEKAIGGLLTYVFTTIADLDNDGTFEIVAATQSHPTRIKAWGKITILEGSSGEQKSLKNFETVTLSKPFVRESKKEARIYIGDSDGCIRIFDRHLQPLKIIKESAPIEVLNTSAPSGSWDFLYTRSQNRLMAFDMDLKQKVFSYKFESSSAEDGNLTVSFFVPLRTNNRQGNYALVNADHLYRLRASPVSLQKKFKNIVNSGLLVSFLSLLLFNGIFIYWGYLIKTFTRLQPLRQKKKLEITQFFEILQGISHQLKNPMSTILWTAEKIKRNINKPGNKEKQKVENYRQLADFLVDDVKTLRQQTNNLLKLIQIQKPCMREKKVKSLLQKIVDHYQALLDENIEIQLEMGEDISLSMDEELFKEAVVNLVDNAIAAMPDGGKLTISAVPVVSPAKGNFSHVLIEIEDTGIGIDEEELSRVFTPFFTKKENGTGIGLTICRRIIEAHNGTINIKSRKDFGTKIAVTIPIK